MMPAIADDARLAMFEQSAVRGLLLPRPSDMAAFAAVRERIRMDERLPGQCHLVTEWIEALYGWERRAGTYLSPDMVRPAGDGAHYWCALPDGSILDPTADQLGEDAEDVRLLRPSDPRHARYVCEWYGDWNPEAPDYGVGQGWNPRDPSCWTGESDYDANRRIVAAHGGDRWWYVSGDRRHVDAYVAKCTLYEEQPLTRS